MGQRHQAILIAKVKPYGSTQARYRCVAAYHHQWCYGTLPLQAARRCMTLMKQPHNAEVIREELRHIDGKYGIFGEEPRAPSVPCPFTTSLLGDSWDIDLSPTNAYSSGVSLQNGMQHVETYVWQYHNDDGITVIDVTNPEDPAYCFLVSPGASGLRTAKEYLGHYYAIPERLPVNQDDVGGDEPSEIVDLGIDGDISCYEESGWRQLGTEEYVLDIESVDVDRIADEHGDPVEEKAETVEAQREKVDAKWFWYFIDGLKGKRLIEYPALSQVWPADYQEILSTEPEEQPPPAEDGMSSLASMPLRKAIHERIESGAISPIDNFWLPDKTDIVEEVLLELSPFPDAALPLLSRLAKATRYRTSSLDLSGYTLSGEQAVAIAKSLGDLHSINLSRNSAFALPDVRTLLTKLPSLRRLVLMNCPNLDDEAMRYLLCTSPDLFRKLHTVIHPYLLQQYFPHTQIGAIRPPAQMSAFMRTQVHPGIVGVSYPFVSPARLVQGLSDLLSATAGLDEYERFEWQSSIERALEVMFSSLPRDAHVPWAERTIAPGMPPHVLQVLFGAAPGWLLLLRPPDITTPWEENTAAWAFLRILGPRARPQDEQKPEEEPKPEEKQGHEEEPEPAGDQESGEKSEPEDKRTLEEVLARFDGKCAVEYELHDLRSFLAATEQEGCTPVTAEAVAALEDALEASKMSWSFMTRELADQLLVPIPRWQFEFS